MTTDQTETPGAIASELQTLIARIGAETTAMWASGEMDPASVRSRVTEDFHGTQYAPWFPDGVWRGDRAGWLQGTRDAAQHYKGKGIRWETTPLEIRPRSADDAVVVYRVDHYADEAEPVARAIFLEAWVRIDGVWHLRRHTSEKV